MLPTNSASAAAACGGHAAAGRDARTNGAWHCVASVVLCFHMPNTPKPDTRPLFTPSTLPQPGAPDPVVTFIEDALLAIANRQDEEKIPEPSA